MGMFDSFYDANNNEWQTKAFNRLLESWRVGDELPQVEHSDYQVEIFGGRRDLGTPVDSYATIRRWRLASINDPRYGSLPLMDYHGHWINTEKEN